MLFARFQHIRTLWGSFLQLQLPFCRRQSYFHSSAMARVCYRAIDVLRSPSGALLVACAVFQFTHWLKPMQAYIVDYAAQVSSISSSTMEDDVLPWFTYVLTPCTLLAGAVFELFGGFAALLVSAVTDVASAWLVMQGRDGDALPITLSEVAFGFSFTSLFTVSACLTAGVPETQYQIASSLNRGAWLASAVVAAGVGQVLSSADQLPATGTVSLITSIISAILLVLFWAGGAFRSVPGPVCCRNCRRDSLRACGCAKRDASAEDNAAPASAANGQGAHARAGDAGRTGGVYAWLDEGDYRAAAPPKADPLLLEGVVPPRFVDTSAAAVDDDGDRDRDHDHDGRGAAESCSITRCLCRGTRQPGGGKGSGYVSAWQILGRCCRDLRAVLLGVCLAVILAVHTLVMVHWQPLLDAISKGEGVNGGVLAAAYVAAIILTSIIALPRLERTLAAWGLRVCAAVLVVCTGCLFGMAASGSLAVAATCLVAYHAVAEAVLALLYAQLGHAVVQLCTPMLLPQRGLLPGVGVMGTTDIGLVNHSGLPPEALDSVGGGASAAISARLHFGSIFTAVTMLSQLVQLAIQYTIGTQGLNLPLRHKFYVLAASTGVLFVIVAIAIVFAPLHLDAPLGPTHPAQIAASSGGGAGSRGSRRASRAFLLASGGASDHHDAAAGAVNTTQTGYGKAGPGGHGAYATRAADDREIEASLLGGADTDADVTDASFPRALDAAVDRSYGY